MKKIRLCIGSNDGEHVAETHMGDTECFYIYDLFENSEHEFVEERVNTAQDMEHAKVEKMEEIINLVQDADVFVARQKSRNFVRIANKTKYQPVVVKTEKISDALTIAHQSFQMIYDYVTRRRNGEVFDAIPEL